MAGADYCYCESCGGRAFYDASLWRETFEDLDEDERAAYAGLCPGCAKTHELIAVRKEFTNFAGVLIIANPSIPVRRIELRGTGEDAGKVLGAIENIDK